jgi:hypothetical protein
VVKFGVVSRFFIVLCSADFEIRRDYVGWAAHTDGSYDIYPEKLMNNIADLHPSQLRHQLPIGGLLADKIIRLAATSWLVVVLIGQWLFASYIALMYAVPVLTQRYELANRAGHITGYVNGDSIGNVMLFWHVLPAALLSLSGVLQLLPLIRRRFPHFHRWNGRLFFVLGISGALTGLFLTWVRGSRLSDVGAIGISINGILIPIAIAFAWRAARARRLEAHKRWAIHAFLLVNAVWTFRLYLMAWFVINGGPNGNNRTLDGPADLTITYACYLLPMLVAELVFWAQKQQRVVIKSSVAFVLILGVMLTGLGVFSATVLMWWPRVSVYLTSFY